MTPENVKLLIDTIGSIAFIGMILGFAIWFEKHASEEDRSDD